MKCLSLPGIAGPTSHFVGFASVGVCQAGAPAKGAAASGDGGAGGDNVVHEIHRPRLHEPGSANDTVLINCEAGKTADHAGMGGFHRMGAANGALDASTENNFRNCSSERKVGCEAPVAGW